jgi:hypothetical protein
MFKVVEDLVVDEIVFNCAFCGAEQVSYPEIPPIIHCFSCHKVLKPNPHYMATIKTYRIRYHFTANGKELANADKTEE